MGKSTAAALLGERGVPVVDTDILARQLVEPGQPALAEIGEAFGAEMIAPDGRLRRDLLAQRVFSNQSARQKLEAILHPRIRQMWQSQVAAWRSNLSSDATPPLQRGQRTRFFCVVIPLLFETHAEKEVDTTICVACSATTQRQRLASRGWSPQQIDQRIASQLPVEEKIARADYVIWNEAPTDVLAAQLDRLLYC